MRTITILVTTLILVNAMVFFGARQPQLGIAAPRSTELKPTVSERMEVKPEDAEDLGLEVIIPSNDAGFDVFVEPEDELSIHVNLDDTSSLDRYYAANASRIDRLLDDPTMRGKTIDVTLTLREPLVWEEFTALRDKTGLEPRMYTFAERGAEGEKWALDVAALPDKELMALVASEADFAGVEVLGVILVEATVNVNAAALGTLASDSRVFAVDTVRVEALELLTQRNVDIPDELGQVDIWVPSPFWSFAWGNAEAD